jgi:inner membrane protein
MDPLTHTLVGLDVAWALPERLRSRTTTAIVLGSSVLPDIDALWILEGKEVATLHRRTFTHSLVGLTLLALLCAFIFSRRRDGPGFGRLFALALLGGACHVLLDLANSFGVALLAPFSMHRFELGLVFVVDPVVWLLAFLPLLVWRRREELRPAVARLGLASIAAYVALCGTARSRAIVLLDRALHADDVQAETTLVFPEPLGPQRWSAAGRSGSSYHRYLVYPFDSRAEASGVFISEDDDPLVRRVREDPASRPARIFLRAPLWRVEGHSVEVRDLRFTYQVLGNDWDPFRFRFRVDGGKVKMTHLPAHEVRERTFEALRTVWRFLGAAILSRPSSYGTRSTPPHDHGARSRSGGSEALRALPELQARARRRRAPESSERRR